MFMGSRGIIWMMFYVSLMPLLIGRGTLANDHDLHSLDDYVHDYAQKVVKWPQTGKLYDISLHSNYSGIEISYIRIRTASIWTRGINSTAIFIPPKTRVIPFVKRLDIIFEDLGKLSSYYYIVPNHKFVTPIIGFAIYNASGTSPTNRRSGPNLSLQGNNTILIRFPNISLKKGHNTTMRCVRFGENVQVEFSNVTVPNTCQARGQGHFAIVVAILKPSTKKETIKWLAIGLGVGIGGLVLLILVGVYVCKFAKKTKMESMQRESEKSENLETVWVGRSKMPSAGGIRTQPVLENDYLP